MNRSIPWKRFVLEVLIVVGSVYVAILLEGAAADRAQRAEAVEALRSLRSELELDRGDLGDILEAQRDRLERHARIDQWLASPSTLPADSMADDLYVLFSVNRTMFPRSSAWTTMVASGQLSDLGDAGLVSDLASFYENRNERLVYNGELYDAWVGDVARSALPSAWNRVDRSLAVQPGPALDRFRSELLVLKDLGANFVGLLESWGEELDELVESVDGYLSPPGVVSN